MCSPLKSLLQSIGLLKHRLEVLLDVCWCHGRMDVDLVEGGLQLSSEHSIKKLCCGLWGDRKINIRYTFMLHNFFFLFKYFCTVFQLCSVKKILHGRAVFDGHQGHHRVILHRQELFHELGVELSPRAILELAEKKETIFVNVFTSRCDVLNSLDAGLGMVVLDYTKDQRTYLLQPPRGNHPSALSGIRI